MRLVSIKKLDKKNLDLLVTSECGWVGGIVEFVSELV